MARRLTAYDAQTLIRKIYVREGLDRTKATYEQKHEAQRRYEITRGKVLFIATRKQEIA